MYVRTYIQYTYTYMSRVHRVFPASCSLQYIHSGALYILQRVLHICIYIYIHTIHIYIYIYVAYDYRSLLQNLVSFLRLFCKRDLYIQYIYTYMCRVHRVFFVTCRCWYGVATISRLLKIVGLFCKRALEKRRYFAKEKSNFKEPTNRSHPVHPPLSTVHPA